MERNRRAGRPSAKVDPAQGERHWGPNEEREKRLLADLSEVATAIGPQILVWRRLRAPARIRGRSALRAAKRWRSRS